MFLQSGTTFRSFASQKDFSFNISLTPYNSSGEINVGFSGSNQYYNFFKLNGGRVYDPLNRFVYSYSKEDSINLSGNFCSGVLDYYINGNLTALNVLVSNSSSSFDNILVSSSSTSLDFDYKLYGGSIPSYNFSFSNPNPLTGQNIFGSVINNSSESWQNFKIFSGSAFFNYTGYRFNNGSLLQKINQSQSGNFSFDYVGNGSDYSISKTSGITPVDYSINLYTNFGIINKTGIIDLGYQPLYFLDFYQFQSGLINNSYYWNYLLEGKLCTGSEFSFKLEKISGFNYLNVTGSQLPVTGMISGLVSGELVGAGFLNGVLTGDLYSNYYDFYGNRLFTGFSAVHSGDYTYQTGFIDATGYRQINSFSGSIFGDGFIDIKYNDILSSRTLDYRDNKYLYSSGNSYDRISTGITTAKLTGEFYEYYIPGKIFLPNTTAVTTPVTGNFSGNNISSVVYSGNVLGSGSINSLQNYTLFYTGIFTGKKYDDTIITGYFTSGVNYSTSIKTGVSSSGVLTSRQFSDFVFSGSGNCFYINTGNGSSEILSGRYILRGLSGSFDFTPNTSSGTSGFNARLAGSNLPINRNSLFAYYPCFRTYPQSSFDNTSLPSGYLITSNLTSTTNFDPAFKVVLGDPLLELNNKINVYWWGTDDRYIYTDLLDDSYIRVSFNDGINGSGLVCNSYCIAPHVLYPSPSDWSISGSNDEINWILLDSQSGQNLEKGYLKVYDVNNSTFYRHLNFQITKTDDPYFHLPPIAEGEILNNTYKRGLAKFNFLNRIPVRYLSTVDLSIPPIDIYSPLKNNISVSQVSTDEWSYGKHRAFDGDLNSETWIFNANSTTNSANNRGVIINRNLQNTGVVSLEDFSQAAEITEAAFNDTYNFYGGSFNTFMGQTRSNFAITNKNNTISNSGVYPFSNQVRLIEVTGSRVVVSAQGETRFLTGISLNTLNSSLYPNSLFTAAEPSDVGWKMGGNFSAQYDIDRTTLFTTGLQNTNGRDYILNNGLIYTSLSGNYITGFPLIRNWSGFSQPNWEMGVDSDGYSQLRYNLHNENNGTQTSVGVSGIISHDLFISQLNQTKKVTYVYGNFSTSKFFKGRGASDNSTNQRLNPQGRNIYCQRMSTGRESILNYEFINSGIAANSIRSMQIDRSGGNLICMGEFTTIGEPVLPNRSKIVFYSLPTESSQIPVAQGLRNEYNGLTGIAQTGFASGGFIMKTNLVFGADSEIYTSYLSGASGLFIGGSFYNPRMNGVASAFTNGKALLLNTSGNNGSGIIITGYNVNSTVWSMDLDNQGNIHLGGEFTSASSTTRNRYARYNAMTAALQPLDLNFNDRVMGLLCDNVNNRLWVVGDFTTVNGGTITRNRAARINLNNNQVEAWNVGNGFNGRVRGVITGLNGDVILYGNFTQFSGINCRGIAKFNSNGVFITGGANLFRGSDRALWTDNYADSSACEIDPIDRSIYLTFIGNNSARGDYADGTDYSYNYRRIIRYNYDTLAPSGVAPNFIHGYPCSIKYWNDRLIIGGDHFSVGYGQFTEGISAFINEPTGQILTTFNPQLNGIVRSACKVSDGLILAGPFNYCGLVPRSGLAKVDFFGNIMTGFNPTCQNPDIIEIKNTASGVFALTSKSWNPDTPGHFYRIDPSNGELLENYSFNISESTYSNGDFFIDNSPSSIGHVVISNVKNYNPSAFIEYTFPNAINSIQGYDITFATGLNPDSFSFMASGITGGLYQVVDSRVTPANSGVRYSNYNINYPLSGIKSVRFQMISKNKIGIRNIDIYTKESGTSLSLSLGNVRGSGLVIYTGVPQLAYSTGYIYQYSEDAFVSVDGLYKQTGYIASGNYSRINNFGDYRAATYFGKTSVDIASGEQEINKIKIPELTGYVESELTLKLKFGFQNNLTSNVDKFVLNKGELNDFTQDKLIFYYKDGVDYAWWQNDQFNSVQTFIDKLNSNFSDYFTGSFNSTTREIKLKSIGAVGHSGNMIYFQPVIKSGLNNFLQQNGSYGTDSFYFSGGQSYFKNFETGVSGFSSGLFSLGALNPPVYFHKKEYRDIYRNVNSGIVSLYDKSKFFTGVVGLGYIPLNSYSSYSFATGEIQYLYNVNLTGWASGWNPRTNSSGIVTGIIKRMGMLTDNAVSGFGPWMNKSFTGVGSEGSVYVIPRTGGGYIEVSPYWSGYFTGTFDFKVPKTGFYSQVTGVPVFLNTGFNWVNYDADFKYNFDMKTGAWSDDGNVRYSGVNIFYNSGTNSYNGTGKIDSTSCLPLSNNKSKFVLFEMNHYNPYNSGNNIMKYTISGLTGSYLFTGFIKE